MTGRTATVERAPRPAALDRLLGLRLEISLELAVYVALFALAFALRFWDLGARALHHDESIHAQWSWRLAQGDYTHDPVFHGPLYYHAQGLMFLILGASDYTARVSAAIFGTAMVALPLLLRRQLGGAGTMAAVALIAFSPTLVYYSRFIREDIYMGFFSLLMIVALVRYLAEGRERWLVLFALALAGGMTTKEATFITVAVLLVFLNGMLAHRLASDTLSSRGLASPWRVAILTAALFPYAWAIAALWPFLGRLRSSAGWDEFPRPADLLVLSGTLTIPLLTPLLKPPLVSLGVLEKGQLDWTAVCHGQLPGQRNDQVALGGLFAITTSAAAFVGLQWRPRTWLICAAAAAAIYLTLMTSFWTNLDGACTGAWGSLDYWITQQDVRRGAQPWFYYFMLMPAYEFLALAIAIAGAWWSVVRGNAFSRLLVFWLVGTWFGLSWAGEKMPWLNVHIALPACLLAAWTVGRAWRAWPGATSPRGALALVSAAVVAGGALWLIAYLPASNGAHLLRVAVAMAAVGLVVFAARPWGRPAAGAFLVVAVAGALALFSLRTMLLAVYERGDVPKDMLIYTQTSPRIAQISSDIDRLASATGKGFDLRIAVDSTDSFAWPWAWYLRDYKAVGYYDFANGLPEGQWDVILANQSAFAKVNDWIAQRGAGLYGNPQRYEHRWWFDERYKAALPTGPWDAATWSTIRQGTLGGEWLDTWFYYWRDHDPDRLTATLVEGRRCQTCGSVDGYAYFPANFDPATGKLLLRPLEAPKPGVDKEGRPTFGSQGQLPGQFFAPVDVEADAAGNLYVIDSATRRLQKFDAAGNFLAGVDVRGDNPGGEAAEPWGLAIAPSGEVVVADTFGWKLRVFSADLKPLASFGQPPASDRAPGNFDLFGPRDAAVDARGQLWVTDTGHDRLMLYTLAGHFIRPVGASGSGPGQFDEPVGIEIGPDGHIYVADMYNSRVQVLDPEGRFVREFRVEGWGGQAVIDKPYLQPLRDGRVAVSLPGRNLVRLYDRNGSPVGEITGGQEAVNRPYGILEAPDGRLWISEGAAGRLRLFELP